LVHEGQGDYGGQESSHQYRWHRYLAQLQMQDAAQLATSTLGPELQAGGQVARKIFDDKVKAA
jgi:hypothetical protein